MLSVITAASLALKSPSDQRCLLYNEGTCWREKSAIPLLKQALFTMRSSSEAALLNLLYSQHVYGLCSSCRIQEACTPKPSGASANPKGRLVLHAHRNTILLHSYDSQTVHATIPPLGKYLASQIRNFMIFWKCAAYPNSQSVFLLAFSFLFSINPKSGLCFLKPIKLL